MTENYKRVEILIWPCELHCVKKLINKIGLIKNIQLSESEELRMSLPQDRNKDKV